MFIIFNWFLSKFKSQAKEASVEHSSGPLISCNLRCYLCAPIYTSWYLKVFLYEKLVHLLQHPLFLNSKKTWWFGLLNHVAQSLSASLQLQTNKHIKLGILGMWFFWKKPMTELNADGWIVFLWNSHKVYTVPNFLAKLSQHFGLWRGSCHAKLHWLLCPH